MSKNANFGGEILQNTSGNIVLRRLGEGEPTTFETNVAKNILQYSQFMHILQHFATNYKFKMLFLSCDENLI